MRLLPELRVQRVLLRLLSPTSRTVLLGGTKSGRRVGGSFGEQFGRRSGKKNYQLAPVAPAARFPPSLVVIINR